MTDFSLPRREAALRPITIVVLALLSAVSPLATDMYLSGLPRIAADLSTSAAGVQMTLTAFLVGLAAGQLLIGPLSDKHGRRGLLMIGTLVGTLSGIAGAFAPTIGVLVALRLVQGLGGAAGVVLARAVIVDRSANAIAAARLMQIMMLIGGLAPVLAPIAGTAIVSVAGWRAVFWVMAALSLLSLVGVWVFVEETLPAEKRHSGGLGGMLRGIGIVLSNRAYVGYTFTMAFTFMVLFGYISASPFVFQEVLGFTPAQYSLVFGVNSVGIAVVSAVSARFVGRVSPRRFVALGLGILLVASLVLLALVLSHAGAALMLPAIFVTIGSVGLVLGNASALAIAEAPHHTGTASAVLGALQFTLGAVASPLVGLGGKGDALPMALTMLGAGLLALASFTLLTRSEQPVGAVAE